VTEKSWYKIRAIKAILRLFDITPGIKVNTGKSILVEIIG